MKISDKCNEVNNNIFFFNALKEEEKKSVLEHIVSCRNCKTLYDRINQINHGIEDHIDDELLSYYTILKFHPKGTDYDRKKLLKTDVQKIGQHLKICSTCRLNFIEMQSLYSDMSAFWMESDLPDIEIKPFKKENKIWESISQNFKTLIESIQLNRRFGYGTLLTAISVLVLTIFVLIDWKKSSLDDLAQLGEINIPTSIRSGDTDKLQKGILLFNQKKYSEAIIQFQQFTENDIESNNGTYSQYLLGLSYINSAIENGETNISLIDIGIVQLKTVLFKTDNTNLRENILWYLGKAYLKKKDIIKAIQYFEKVYEIGGIKANESRAILIQLKEINNF